jgi:hypothetical protein
MMVKAKPLGRLPQIPEAITYLERRARGEAVVAKQIEELYLQGTVPLQEILLSLAHHWGDQLAMRQILFFHYLQQEPLMKEILHRCIYPQFDHKVYRWNEPALKRFLAVAGLTESEQTRSIKIIEKALTEMRLLTGQGQAKVLEYQRPTIEAVAYAFYAEYGDGFTEGRRFSLMNPPVEQIMEHAAFPSYFLMDPRAVPMMLEACRIKNYISLEARGGLCQYALIYQDLVGLVEYMVQGGRT